MIPNTNLPTLSQLTSYLDEYGWKYRESTTGDNEKILVAPYKLINKSQGILISFRCLGEYVMVSTVDFLIDVPREFTSKALHLNDTIKLVKLFSLSSAESQSTVDIEVGFELWAGSWHKETFFAFIDSLCLAIETISQAFVDLKIPHETKFVNFGQ